MYIIRPRPPRPPATIPQLAQRDKFGMLHRWMWTCDPDLDERGIEKYIKKLSREKTTVTKILKEAIVSAYPDFAVDCSKTMLSNGRLSPLDYCKIEVMSTQVRLLTWIRDQTDSVFNKPSDLVQLLIYSEDKGYALYVENACKCKNAGILFDIDADFIGDVVHLWVFLISKNGEQSSKSTYVGVL